MNAPTNDQEIIQRILDGHAEDYAELIHRHQDHIYGLCLSLMKNPTDAEDAAQEIFLKAYRRLRDFRFESSFSTWLYRVAYYHSLDLLKARSRRPAESLDALTEARGEFAAETAEIAEPTEQTDLARQTLESLAPAERLILTLREIQGLTYEELSETLALSLDAVKSRLRRARESLRLQARHFSASPVVQSGGDPK
ncbi:MAG: sigma-70 family RNA polymerase sigma factor [Elusimicrobia bacterium]|nr:sigma-70 family RNA polymerase sigma factor [Elusimicrobiota bacterium]